MSRRAGATLIEVLVAIFVMGIGLIALLALFPLGAMRMAQAIQDDRTANIGMSADAIATLWNIRRDTNLTSPTDAFTNPGGALTAASASGPSYPVFVDPAGYRSAFGASQTWLGGVQGVPRRSVSFVENATSPSPTYATLRWFSFLDDILFESADPLTTGYPKYVSAGVFEREIHYSWAYLCQKPRLAEPSVVNLAVVVFNRRTLALTGNLTLSEYVYDSSAANGTSAVFDLSRNVVTVDYGAGTPPPVRTGDWIMDATLVTTPTAYAHGYFYRVVSVTEVGGTAIEYEVQSPFRGFTGAPILAGTQLYSGRVIALEGVVEVFEKGPGRNP